MLSALLEAEDKGRHTAPTQSQKTGEHVTGIQQGLTAFWGSCPIIYEIIQEATKVNEDKIPWSISDTTRTKYLKEKSKVSFTLQGWEAREKPKPSYSPQGIEEESHSF